MELAIEPIERKRNRTVPVASYISDEWGAWLQSHRVELNAMSSPQFLDWLNRKMEQHSQGKLIPPAEVLGSRLAQVVRDRVFDATRDRILREQRFEEQAEIAMQELQPALSQQTRSLQGRVERSLKESPTDSWRVPIDQFAVELTTGRRA